MMNGTKFEKIIQVLPDCKNNLLNNIFILQGYSLNINNGFYAFLERNTGNSGASLDTTHRDDQYGTRGGYGVSFR